MHNSKLFRIATVPSSLNILLKGQLAYLQKYFDITAISGAGNSLEELKKREKVKIQAITMHRKISPLYDIISLVKLYLYFKYEKPLIVHSITPKAGLLSMIAAKMAGVPIRIHTFTGLIFPTKTGLLQRLLIAMDKLLCTCATNIIPEGNGVKNDLESYGITKKPLKIIANGNVNGIDLEYFHPQMMDPDQKQLLRQSLVISATDFVFTFVGRLVGDKGINELVKAFDKLNLSGVKLLLVGPFEPKMDPLLSDTLKIMETNPNIISVGYQKDVRPYYAISDALVFPSYREGFPNVVMQAGAMEIPAIVTNINGCNEIIQEGVNGTIIPPKNIEALKIAMQRFVSDEVYLLSLKKNARTMISSRFEQTLVWESLLKEYKELIHNIEKA
ncbi:MAG: glycosyltransferase family 4 protein [Bacteroidetes bacterium]|nr:glycosyltransferase family 4 protein [Bacteroidota bacterium]